MTNATKAPKTHPCADPLLEEIWRIKDELSASYGHDVHRLFAEARERQKHSGHPVVNLQGRRRKPASAIRRSRASEPLAVKEEPASYGTKPIKKH